MLTADAAHGNLVRIWQLDDPQKNGEHSAILTTATNWTFSARVNSGSLWMSAYTEGVVYDETSTIYESQILYLTGAGNEDATPVIRTGQSLTDTPLQKFKDLGVTWSYPIRTETRLYYGHSNWTGSEAQISYLVEDQNGFQFGNPMRTLFRELWFEYDPDTAPYHHAAKSQFWPNKSSASSNAYITGLPGREITVSCNSAWDLTTETNLKSEKLYLYDQHTSYSALPTQGNLTTTLVRANKPGEAVKYMQSSYTYTVNGNPEKTIAFKAYVYLPAHSASLTLIIDIQKKILERINRTNFTRFPGKAMEI